jgi:autotransporter-associated beta strand protein
VAKTGLYTIWGMTEGDVASSSVRNLCMTGGGRAVAGDAKMTTASWTGNTNHLYGIASNWDPSGPPTEQAIFGTVGSGHYTIDVSTFFSPGAWLFTDDQDYVFNQASGILTFGGSGIKVAAGSATINAAAALNFQGEATAGNVAINSSGNTRFRQESDAGEAVIEVTGGTFYFQDDSSAAQATIQVSAGRMDFEDGSSAGTSEIVNEASIGFNNPASAAGATITNQGTLTFSDEATAGSATITSDDRVRFQDKSGLGDAVLSGDGDVTFTDRSSAGTGRIENNDGEVEFQFFSTAADSEIVQSDGILSFNDLSTAGNSLITIADGYLEFYGDATAGEAEIHSEGVVAFHDHSTAGSAAIDADWISFENSATAGDATIVAEDVTFTFFADAGSAQITSNSFDFEDYSSAGSANLIVNDEIEFYGESSAGSATIVMHQSGSFYAQSTAGTAIIDNRDDIYVGDQTTLANATVTTRAGAEVYLDGDASGGAAAFITEAGGLVDFSGSDGPGDDGINTAGTFAGAGIYDIGANTIRLGGNNANATLTGTIDGDGTIIKVGTGRQVLAGDNTFAGGTFVNGGTLRVDGSILNAAIVNSGGTLEGNGVVDGLVTINSGGRLGAGASAGELTTNGVVLKAGAIFEAEIGGTAAGSTYDQLAVSGGVTLGGATLDASLIGGFQPSASGAQSFVIIDNDGADAVSGTFAGLAEGATFTASNRFFTISYKGGTGNDVVLTSAGARVAGTAGNDTISGSAAPSGQPKTTAFADTISGLAGNDVIAAGAGNDTINGGTGTDIAVYGGAWKDYLVTRSGSTYTVKDLRSGSPDDTDTLTNVEQLRFSNGTFAIASTLRDAPAGATIGVRKAVEAKAFSFNAAALLTDADTPLGDDLTFDATGLPAWLKLDAATGVFSGKPGFADDTAGKTISVTATDLHGASVTRSFTLQVTDVKDIIVGSAKKNKLTGDKGVDDIRGLGGNDTLSGKGGKDILNGGDGNDLLIGGGGGDRHIGGKGKDTASYQDMTAKVVASLANAKANKGAANGDTYGGVENLTGGAKGDVLNGSDGANVIKGLAGNDTLKGLKGNDRLEGGLGRDTLTGGGNADAFVFRSLKDSPAKKNAFDLITDFSRKQGDRIDLSAIDAKTGKKNQAFTFIEDAAFSKTKGELRYEKFAKSTFVYGDVNGDGKADLKIQIAKAIDLKLGDFVV